MRSTVHKNNFAYGELSPRAKGRWDFDKVIFKNGADTLENFLSYQLGGALYRPGTSLASEVKTSADATRLIPFSYSNQQNYAIEAGDYYYRFYASKALLTGTAASVIDTNTALLIHAEAANGTTSYTAETGQEVSFLNGAHIVTAQHAFATDTSSIAFDTNDYISVPMEDNFYLGTGNFTIEMWFRTTSTGSTQVLMCQATDGSHYIILEWDGVNMLFLVNGATIVTAAMTINNNTWYHIAITRSGTTFTISQGGVSRGTGTSSVGLPYFNVPIIFGAQDISGSTGNPLIGFLDEIRISKIARYTSFPFTPSTIMFSTPAAWATPVLYAVGDVVVEATVNYYCLVGHTSGTFATDLAAGYWTSTPTVELVTPYPKSVVGDLQFAQKDDVMYQVHQSYEQRKLQRVSATKFRIDKVQFKRPPVLDTNVSGATITASAATGAGITLTARLTALFKATHVGSQWRIKSAMVKITSFTNEYTVIGDVQPEPDGTAGNIGSTAAQTDWAEAAWSDYQGWPIAVCFHEGRLWYGGTTKRPQSFWGSVTGAYDNFKTGTADSDAVSFTLTSNKVNNIMWMASSGSLKIGTVNGTMSVSSGSSTAPITATNIFVTYDTDYGVARIRPKSISSYLYYLQSSKFQVRELSYQYTTDSSISDDMNLLADHILRDGSGAVTMARQMSPNDRLWVVRTDGQIAVLTRNVAQQVMGWCRVVSGHSASGEDGVVEDICILQEDGADDTIYVIVKRNINGSYKRFVEYFNSEIFDDDWDSVNVDCSLTMDKPNTITAIVKATGVISYTAGTGSPALSNSDYIKIDNVVGMTELNGNTYLVSDLSVGVSFKLKTLAGVYVDTTAYSTYISGGEARKKVDTVSGLSHLNGEVVTCQCDSDTVETATVAAGSITLSAKYAVIHAGLPYTGTLKFLEANDGGIKKSRRYTLSTLSLFRSLGGYIGQDVSNLASLGLTANSGKYFTGDIEVNPDTSWGTDIGLTIKQTTSLPLFILGAVFNSEVEAI